MGQRSFAVFLCGLIKIENDFLISTGSEQPNAEVLKVGSENWNFTCLSLATIPMVDVKPDRKNVKHVSTLLMWCFYPV